MPKKLSTPETDSFLQLLEMRFQDNMQRHQDLSWDHVRARLDAQPEKLSTLFKMEETGGEPDVVGRDADGIIYCDCSPESPAGRRSLCYDEAALRSRKQNKPRASAIDAAREIGGNILTETQYLELQKIGDFDLKTSSWIMTDAPLRALGGALFGDKRYGRTFIYHNGAESYYAARGFRVQIKV